MRGACIDWTRAKRSIEAKAVMKKVRAMQAPRFYEYVADLAPKEQTGTYMGFAFLPVAIGAFVAGPLSGYLINHYLKGSNPGGMWTLLSAIGFGATVCMLLYDRFLAPK